MRGAFPALRAFAVVPAFVLVPALALALTLLLCLPAPSAAAQGEQLTPPGREEAVELYAYTLRHQRAMEALKVIQPLLSSQGTVELRPQDNILVIRDRSSTLKGIVLALRRFDQPPRPLTIEVLIVEARRASFSPLLHEQELPPALQARLKEILPYSNYRVLARTELHTREGEAVTYELGEDFTVEFQPDRVIDGRQLRLRGFRLSRQRDDGPARRLIASTLSLRLDNYMALTLASTESSSTALMVVLNPRVERWGTGNR